MNMYSLKKGDIWIVHAQEPFPPNKVKFTERMEI